MPHAMIVPRSEAPKKLENFLKKRFNVGYVRKLFRKNGVRLNGKRSGPAELTRPGDRIELFIPYEKQAGTTKPRALPCEIVFEDDELIVLNKPAGIAAHEGKGILKRDSVLGMLEAAYRPRGVKPLLAHRIDKETSGLLVAAKKDEVAEQLEALFESRDVEKEYLTLVVGRLHPKIGTIELPLPGRDGRSVSAVTHYKVEQEFSETTLVRVRIETGRMHQIRLHFAKSGHPVVMDDEHGDFTFNKQFRKKYGLKRQFLHAAMIAFEYRGKKRKWTAELPEDLERTVRSLASA
jgi:23S rRNA pseudouridine955/2504/2580 synthase